MMEIKRDRYLDALIARKNNGSIKVITGIRRCGKSYLLNTIFYNHLIEVGVPEDHIMRFAFDSARDLKSIGIDYKTLFKNNDKVDPDAFLEHVDSIMTDDGGYYLLLDEVQYLDCFEAVLNGYLRDERLDVYVTGSNSKSLSKDVITEFAGRGDEIRMHPLSYSEFCRAYDGPERRRMNQYMTFGGLPAAVIKPDDDQRISYLRTQMENVYSRDIVKRHNLSNEGDLNDLMDVIASGTATLVNPARLASTFKTNRKSGLSAYTIGRYIEHMEESFIIEKARRYDVKGRKYIGTPFKIYFEDLGLRNARLDFRQMEPSHLMENMIFNELRYRGFNVDVGVVNIKETADGHTTREQLEVDFIANKGSRRYYVQSASDIPDSDERNQETRPFRSIGDSFKKIIVVDRDIPPHRDDNGYLMIGLEEFLLNEDSLDL